MKGIINRVRIDADYYWEQRLIIVLPLKRGPYSVDKLVDYFETCTPREKLTNTTHYYIIVG